MSGEPFVESQLLGFFDPAYVPSGRVTFAIGDAVEGILEPEAIPIARIHDARHLQAAAQVQASYSEAAFFEKHGFALLPHESAVKDWDTDTAVPENELARVYLPEIETLIRTRLLAGRKIDLWQAPPIRRGPGTANPEYAGGVHQDFGMTTDDYHQTLEAFAGPLASQTWRSRFEQDDVAGFMSINFWRTAGMRKPLQHMPLSFCHPDSVGVEDLIPVGLLGLTPTGEPTNQLGLRYTERQRWYYYPAMTPDEVLVFKQFQFSKDDPKPLVTSCFHSAFEHPDTPPEAEVRQSSEQRVLVFCLRD